MNSSMSSAAPIANDAALIATFYYLRDPSGQHDLTEPLQAHLKQELRLNQPDGNPKVWLERFNPIEISAHDIRVVQLTLNATDQSQSAEAAWVNLSDRLDQLLGDEVLFSGMIGYSLVYQAVLKQRIDPLFASVLPNKSNRIKLLLGKPSAQVLKPLATTDTEYGRLWLLDIPLQEEGRQASAVYVAICLEDGNDDFVGRVLWGESASWLLPDLIAHKSYHQIRQYRGIVGGQVPFSATLQQVRNTTLELLSGKGQQKESKEFSQLSERAQTLIGDMARLGALRITLAKQQYNYSQWVSNQASEIATFHDTRIKANLKEIELNLAEAETVLKATDTALNIMQTRLNKIQERRQFWITMILTFLGVVLAVPNLINGEVTNALWAWWDGDLMRDLEAYNTLQVWGVQLGIIAAIVGLLLLLLLMIALYRAIRDR